MVVKKYVKAKTNKMYGGVKPPKSKKPKKSWKERAVGLGARTAPKFFLRKGSPGGLTTAKSIKKIAPGVSYRDISKVSAQMMSTKPRANLNAMVTLRKIIKKKTKGKVNYSELKNKTAKILKMLKSKVSVSPEVSKLAAQLPNAPGALKAATTAFEEAKAAFTALEQTKPAAAPPKPVTKAAPAAAAPKPAPAAPPQTKAPPAAAAAAPAQPKPVTEAEQKKQNFEATGATAPPKPAPAKPKPAPAKAKKTPKTKAGKAGKGLQIKGTTTTSSKTDSGPGVLKRTAKAVGKSIKKGASGAAKGVSSAAKGASKFFTGVAKATERITQISK